MTKPTIWLCAQRRLRSAWASAHSDQSLRCAFNGQLRPEAFFMPIERTAKTLFAGRTTTLLVLSWGGSYLSRDTHKGSLVFLFVCFFRNSVFYNFQKNYLFLIVCENMMVVSLLFTFLEHFKFVYSNMCWYVFMTSLDVVNILANLLTLRNMRHVHFYAFVP